MTMLQVAQNYKTGEVLAVEVPRPAWRPGGVLVKTEASLISTGTERMKVDQAKMSLLGKARARPDQVKQVLDSVSQQGLLSTYRKVTDRLDSLTPLGYSAAGTVEHTGEGAEDLRVGSRVACAGDQYAFHAEYIWVPRNLCVPVPEGVSTQEAAFTTVGSIAMQAVRQGDPKVGEFAVVIGLGLIGQLIARILVSAGIRVVGLDLSDERCKQALSGGVEHALSPDPDAVAPLVSEFTDHQGADCVFLATSTASNQPTELAAELARDRARIVDVGNTKLDLPWKTYYEKELSVHFSRSYGPGRYDRSYEVDGVDYPIGYVRWTERRNMSAFLSLVAEGSLNVTDLIGEVVDIADATGIYERIHEGDVGSIGVLFSYGREHNDPAPPAEAMDGEREVAPPTRGGRPRIGCIGAGNYASSMLLPHLQSRDDVDLAIVATTGGLSAANAKRRSGFERTTSDSGEIFADGDIDAVMVLTRHDSHAAFVEQGLRSGKFVYVEKPPAVTTAELAAIRQAALETGNSRLMVGYNRRFSPLLSKLREAWAGEGPQQISYAVNAGSLDEDSWYHDRASQGSRFIGEGGHFVDTISWWLGCDPVEVYAQASHADPDDLQAILRYSDGSVAHIAYTTGGDSRFPKERITFSSSGQSAVVDNFSNATIWARGKKRKLGFGKGIDKGQSREMDALVSWISDGKTPGASFESLMATSLATFAVDSSLRTGLPVAVNSLIEEQVTSSIEAST